MIADTGGNMLTTTETMRWKSTRAGTGGFSLVEVIITLVVAAILAAMLGRLLGTSLLDSAEPLNRTQNLLSLEEVVETITADYKKLMVANAATALSQLKADIDAGNYGAAYTFTTKYIGFTPGNVEKPSAEGDTILKVTVGLGNHELVTIFTR